MHAQERKHPRSQATVRELAAIHRSRSEQAQAIELNTLLALGPSDAVIDFCEVIRTFGGEYEPFRDWGDRPKVITGRRASSPPLYALRMKIGGKQKYTRNERGVIRRVA